MTDIQHMPLILLSGLQRTGTTLIHRLFDGHPGLYVHPSEMRFSQNKHRWPDLSVCVLLKSMNIAYEHSMGIPIWHLQKDAMLKKLTKNFEYDNPDFDFDFTGFLSHWRSSLEAAEQWSEGLVMFTLLRSFFANLKSHPARPADAPIAIKTPRLGLDVERFFQLFPKGKLVFMRRQFDSFAASEIKRNKLLDMNWKCSRVQALRRFLGGVSRGEPWGPGCRSMVKRESQKVHFLRKLAGDHKFMEQVVEDCKGMTNVMVIDYEELIADTRSVMWRLADFLEISRDGILLRPTLYGEDWISNSSFGREKGKIDQGVMKRKTWTGKELARIQSIYKKAPVSTLDDVLG
jgi:hypothetical protein